MAQIVSQILESTQNINSHLKSCDVSKAIDIEIDAGNLLAIDRNALEIQRIRSEKDVYLMELARDNTQSLLNKLWQLPFERLEDAIVVTLPDCKTILPREKPIPKANPATKWESFAKLKGIKKKKKERMVWDENEKKYKPSWGYKRVNEESKTWVLEVPENADPMEDQFEKMKKAKKEKVAKNELQRLRNISRNMKGKTPGIGITPDAKPDKSHLSRALHVAQGSDASLGRFSNKAPKEEPVKNMGKKRKFESNTGSLSDEKRRAMSVLNRITNNKPVLNVTAAVNQKQAKDDKIRQSINEESGKKKKGFNKSKKKVITGKVGSAKRMGQNSNNKKGKPKTRK